MSDISSVLPNKIGSVEMKQEEVDFKKNMNIINKISSMSDDKTKDVQLQYNRTGGQYKDRMSKSMISEIPNKKHDISKTMVYEEKKPEYKLSFETDIDKQTFTFRKDSINIGSFSIKQFVKYIFEKIDSEILDDVSMLGSNELIEKYIGYTTTEPEYNFNFISYLDSPLMSNMDFLMRMTYFLNQYEKYDEILNTSDRKLVFLNVFYDFLNHSLLIISLLTDKYEKTDRKVKDSLIKYSTNIINKLSIVNKKIMDINQQNNDKLFSVIKDLFDSELKFNDELYSIRQNITKQDSQIELIMNSLTQTKNTAIKDEQTGGFQEHYDISSSYNSSHDSDDSSSISSSDTSYSSSDSDSIPSSTTNNAMVFRDDTDNSQFLSGFSSSKNMRETTSTSNKINSVHDLI
jgi:hypothetical protein